MQDQVQEFEVVDIQSHPTHGDFQVEVPMGWDNNKVKGYVDGLDLDLLLGIEGDTDIGETNVEKIKEWENSVGAGKRDGKWFSHTSLEGGTDTLAYGHKLTPEEADTGTIKIGDKEVDWRQGLTEEQAITLLNQDAGWAKKVAMASLKKTNMHEDDGKVQALTSLIYNVGSGAWGKSKAKKYLEAGYIEDFMYEAFDKEVGFVKISGDISRGLQRRRAAEAQLFAGGNITEEQTVEQAAEPDPMQSVLDRAVSVLEMLNPVSSAQASTLPPDAELLKGNTLADIEVPRRPEREGGLANISVPRRPKKTLPNLGEVEVPERPEEVPKFFKESVIPVYGDHAYAALKHIGTSMLEQIGLPVPDSFKEPITEKNLDPDVLNVIRVAGYKAWKKGGNNPTVYDDYGDAAKIVYGNERAKLGKAGLIKEGVSSFFDPATAAGLTIGQSGTVRVKDGRLKIINDRYDFIKINPSKTKDDLWLQLQSLFSDEGGFFQVSPENQQKIEIDLGPVEEVEKYVKSLEDKDSNPEALPITEATVP